MTDQKILDLDVDAPPEFLCPITMSIMKDPVIMPDGQTYERDAIKKALEANPVSPLTRQPMKIEDAKVNYALKSLIEKYIQDHLHEAEENDKPIDPSNIVHASNPTSEIPVTHLNEFQLESFTAQYKDDLMLISIKPQSIVGRIPISIIAMIDISGSMDCDASLALPGTEDTSLTRLQLVQYSLKTIISVLGKEDRITLITFNDSAQIQLENTLLTDEGKDRASKVIDSFRPHGCTNIWDALDKGIDQAIKEKALLDKYNQDKYQINTSLLLFTDGEPNQNPPMGIIPSLEDKLSDINVHFSISSFGFGYQIDSELMEDIAQIGNGIYGYCPDATMVGTILISYMSSIISMISPLSILDVKFNNGNQTKNVLTLYNGATTSFMIKLDKNDNPNDVQINLNLPLTNQHLLVTEIKSLDGDEKSELNFRDQKFRKLLIDLILNCKKNNLNCDESIQKVKDLFEEIRQVPNRTQFLNNLMIDLFNDDEKHGQIERAYRRDYFNKWGKNYLYSLVRFHIVEQCGNFKDMSLQLYGNDTFKKFRKMANKIFMNLPIPEKRERVHISRYKQRGHSPQGSGGPSLPNRHVTMRSYNSRSVGCFNGDSLIKLAGGKEKKVSQLVKGDILSNGAKVLCLVKTATENGQSYVVKIGDALFTPYHPVKVNIPNQKEKSWTFPINISEPEKVTIDFWYNIVLDNYENSKYNNNGQKSYATAIIGGVEAVTFGHGINEGVCKHPYFGTEKVISALKKHNQFESGLIEFKKPPTIKRDPITDMIIECF